MGGCDVAVLSACAPSSILIISGRVRGNDQSARTDLIVCALEDIPIEDELQNSDHGGGWVGGRWAGPASGPVCRPDSL